MIEPLRSWLNIVGRFFALSTEKAFAAAPSAASSWSVKPIT